MPGGGAGSSSIVTGASAAQAPLSPLGSLEAENELKQFLKLARPDWSKPRRRGRSDIARVLSKLKGIGVTDIDGLVKRVEKNSINEELYNSGAIPLSREALDSIRKQRTFRQALESVDVPNVRQVGAFDPVAQMLSRKRLASAHLDGRASSPIQRDRVESAGDGGLASTLSRNKSAPSGLHRGGFGDGGGAATWSPSEFGVGSSAASISEFSQISELGRLRLRGARIDPRRERLASAGRQRRRQPVISGIEGDENSDGSKSPNWYSPRVGKGLGVTWSAGSAGRNDAGSETAGPLSPSPPPTASMQSTGQLRAAAVASKPFVAQSAAQAGAGNPSSPELGATQRSLTSSLARPSAGTDSSGARADTPTSEELVSLRRAAESMQRSPEDPAKSGAAKWSQRSLKSPLEQGEDMLREARALDDLQRLVRQVKTTNLRAPDPFRSHIARNIKQRLRAEARHDSTEGLAIDQQCMNISKQLGSMTNARKELVALRAKVKSVLLEEPGQPSGQSSPDLSMAGRF
eukprot:TRINITY_DN62479_c0_g1_i1.p1 TRINITY_DN62479_c0_g1~~TRINITY_DN62479_c0_g1_i1.p1  ORF type:complete len:536 (-),score=84.85 TRINITY_DN62479_c0_g1_i1:33-1589(-)